MGFYGNRKQEMQAAAEEAARTGDNSRARQLMQHTLSESEGGDVIEQMRNATQGMRDDE